MKFEIIHHHRNHWLKKVIPHIHLNCAISDEWLWIYCNDFNTFLLLRNITSRFQQVLISLSVYISLMIQHTPLTVKVWISELKKKLSYPINDTLAVLTKHWRESVSLTEYDHKIEKTYLLSIQQTSSTNLKLYFIF